MNDIVNNIVMIPTDQLFHHPENPRQDLGELTELTESIRKNGVMQNLTVIKGHRMTKAEWVAEARAEGADKVSAESSYRPEEAWTEAGYTVVIGNRRMEAAKQAGLEAVPCVISDMDHKTQISTMLEENMQRSDLTVYEQAQGFQMMMDLGYSAKDISEKTGFSETTVNRRLKMAELDPKELKKACEAKNTERQITLYDFERLSRVKSVKERNALLKVIGDRDFAWSINRTLHRQQANEVKPRVKQLLKEAGVEPIPKSNQYGVGYVRLWNNNVRLYEWKEGDGLIPEKLSEKQRKGLRYEMDEDSLMFFAPAEEKKEEKKPEKSAKEKEKEKARADAWKQIEDDHKQAQELRKAFISGLKITPKNAPVMMTFLARAICMRQIDYSSPREAIRDWLKLETSKWEERMTDTIKALEEIDMSRWTELIGILFEGDKVETYAEGIKAHELPKYKKNYILDEEYNWLTSYGYQMSQTEIQLMNGTHPVFQTEVEK